MKYPFVIFFRYEKYSYIDIFFQTNKDKLLCSLIHINAKTELNKIFDSANHLLVTFGNTKSEYFNDVNDIIPERMFSRWIHYDGIHDLDSFNCSINVCYMKLISDKCRENRPIFSLFTTCYNSYEKILRAYKSVKEQTLHDWEWVILDDSPDDKHFSFLINLFKDENKIRLYKRSVNSGSIGNVKNEAVSLCRGKYVIELDHDDEILPGVLSQATNVFEKDSEIGFIYMDYANIYENGDNFNYGTNFSLGYAGYYRQKYNNRWLYVASTPNINNITLSHIVAVPNHPRIWRKSTLLEIGNYNEYLPVSDDYELLLRTAVNTKITKIHTLGYIQYMNNNDNNFSLIRNSEINRLCNHITYHCFQRYNIDNSMKAKTAYEEVLEEYHLKAIWKRKNYTYKYANNVTNIIHSKQYCIIGLETLYKYHSEITELYKDTNNDFVLLENKYEYNDDALCNILDNLSFDRMKCYSMKDCTEEELINYFHLIYKSSLEHCIMQIKCDIPNIQLNTQPSVFKSVSLENIPKERKKITIITPCIRPKNLIKMINSINFKYVNEWIIVYDGSKITSKPNVFFNERNFKIKEYIHTGEGKSGNPQRNYGIEQITNTNTYLYFLDDDNIIHPELYKLLDRIEDNKIYTFDQERPVEVFPYKEQLLGDKIELFNIDTAMFLVDYNLCKNIRWDPDKYHSDGIYIMECYSYNKDNWVYINKLMSYYNKIFTQ